MRCRMMPRCRGVVSFSSLCTHDNQRWEGHRMRNRSRSFKAISPLALSSFQQPFNGRADCAVRTFDQRFPSPGEFPLGTAALLSLRPRPIGSGDLEIGLIIGDISDIVLVGIGHGGRQDERGIGRRWRVCSGAAAGPSSDGAPSVQAGGFFSLCNVREESVLGVAVGNSAKNKEKATLAPRIAAARSCHACGGEDPLRDALGSQSRAFGPPSLSAPPPPRLALSPLPPRCVRCVVAFHILHPDFLLVLALFPSLFPSDIVLLKLA